MTRLLLTLALASLTLAVGLWAAVVVSYNHQRAENLARLQGQHEIQHATNDQAAAQAAAHVRGRGPEPSPRAADEDGAPLVEGMTR